MRRNVVVRLRCESPTTLCCHPTRRVRVLTQTYGHRGQRPAYARGLAWGRRQPRYLSQAEYTLRVLRRRRDGGGGGSLERGEPQVAALAGAYGDAPTTRPAGP
jgi:hypothetical protein